jgi:hypothetical protein
MRFAFSTNGDHLAIQVGELVFDNNNVGGIPFIKWLDDLCGLGCIQPSGRVSAIQLHEESFGSQKKCK